MEANLLFAHGRKGSAYKIVLGVLPIYLMQASIPFIGRVMPLKGYKGAFFGAMSLVKEKFTVFLI